MKEKKTYDDDLEDTILPQSQRTTPFIVPLDFFDQQAKEIKSQVELEKKSIILSIPEDTVPEFYFETLENNILTRINELKLKEKINTEGFSIPEDYFSQLSNTIHSSVFIEDLKSTISDNDFETPKDYFSTLEDSIVANIAAESFKDKVTTDGFDIPSSYFKNLESTILSKVALDRLTENSHNEEFTVPADYFDKAEKKILETIKDTTEVRDTPIISLPKHRVNWSKYAVAATILLISISAILSFFTTENAYNPLQRKQLVSAIDLQGVSDEELVDYLAQISDDDDLMHLSQMVEDKVSERLQSDEDIKTEDIEDYLNYML